MRDTGLLMMVGKYRDIKRRLPVFRLIDGNKKSGAACLRSVLDMP
jgi:hypothetical protein